MKCTDAASKSRRSFAMAASFVLLAATGHSATALDDKIYAGSFCQPANNSHAPALEYDTGKGVRNSSSSSRIIVCPIVRDFTSNTNGVGNIWVTGYRTVTGSPGDFSCTVVASDHHGNNIYGNPPPANTSATFPTNTGRVVVKITGVKKSRKDAGNYSMRCVVPRLARLVEYEIEEH